MGRMELTQHPLAAYWPPKPEPELADLERSIRAHGVIDPIIVTEDGTEVLDGWHRYSICLRLDLECPMRVAEPGDYVDLVIARNATSRLLPALTRAKIVARCRTWHPPHRVADDDKGDNGHPSEQVSTPQSDHSVKTTQEMADEANVNKRTMQRAKAAVRAEDEAAAAAAAAKTPLAAPTLPDPADLKPDAEPESPAAPAPEEPTATSGDQVRQEQNRRAQRRDTATKTLTLREKHDDALNMLAGARKEVTVAKRLIADLERRIKAMLDDARPDLAARMQEMKGVQRENEILRDRMQHWQQRYEQEQRRSQFVRKERDFFQKLCEQNGIDTSISP